MRSCHLLVCEQHPVPTELLGLLNSLILRRDLATALGVALQLKELGVILDNLYYKLGEWRKAEKE
ncbi:hypothetical protein Lpp77_14192 [Lacticaseibacillus paracasei subsp. paracasei CNCM I-4270]|uniref:Uncharacterized protein n=1 Tax=Lacticaseibacillus paracasei subsp. paracasei CNCM I-4270 TaxID=1256202 RepID=A0A8E0IFP7_LACPA|nr:hypothetical protein Lpp77_14192 [Lacticaseibacillus paracasei subsp. paracasei CNCM I-4270]